MKTTSPLTAVLLVLVLQTVAPADDWPQWRGPNRDGVWRETGIVDKFDAPEIKPRWRVPIAGGYCGPTVADGRVYVADRVTEPRQMERVHCFEWKSGKKLWTHEYDCEYKISYTAGPRASITVDDGRAYMLGSMGHFCCLDAASGKLLWKKDPVDDFHAKVPIWGVAAAPLVEGESVILQIGGADGACVVALDRKTGKRRWAALDDPASYCAPIAVEHVGRRVVVVRTGTRAVGLNAGNGEVYWQHELGYAKWVIAIATPVVYEDRLFFCSVDKGSLVLRMLRDEPRVEKLWWRYGPNEKQTDSLQSLIGTPCLIDGHAYGASLYGMLRCIELEKGDRLWANDTVTSQARWGTVHIVRNGRHAWMFNDRGELIIAQLTPQGYREIDRATLIEPTTGQLRRRDGVTWSHPAFAYKHVFIRNDEALVCASLGM
ncbi:MAG: PQQ-like beta-propeller repeat protein [Candidatus Nealsonbacteria bacterium]|nr:PQQ-like beta-propeller repeat protein [Candidatus Nealsonbacteria bacterium]